jgi:hypothetical protein
MEKRKKNLNAEDAEDTEDTENTENFKLPVLLASAENTIL